MKITRNRMQCMPGFLFKRKTARIISTRARMRLKYITSVSDKTAANAASAASFARRRFVEGCFELDVEGGEGKE